MFTASRKQIYIPLSNQDDDEESLFAGLSLPSKSAFFSGLCVVLALLASFIAGTMYTPTHLSGYKYALYSNGNSESEKASAPLSGLAHRIPLRAVAGEILLNSPLSREPKSGVGEREGVWSELIPAGLGYFTESVVPNGNGSTALIPAAFRQLHCLRTLRRAYYAPRFGDGTDDGEAADVTRCFDYLAQSIVCEADSTVEPVDYESGGGFQRQCWDFEALTEYVQDRRVSGAEGV
ncbi:hypothetical protein BJY00DRAFT_205580 [Aspergillus carlsbadensis]|nr:hypothetical protein BJY00DRAFT_205580 [Aspergillus carlsbadensis]